VALIPFTLVVLVGFNPIDQLISPKYVYNSILPVNSILVMDLSPYELDLGFIGFNLSSDSSCLGVLFFFFFLIASKPSLQVNDDVDIYLSLWNSAWNPSNDIHALPKKNLFIQNLIKSLVHMDYQ
jgi:hypothetical protein